MHAPEAPHASENTTTNIAKPTDPNEKKIEWSKENELILVEWCDVAQCYKWLNSRSHMKYAYKNAWFTIPAIILSTLTGTASFAQTSIPLEYQTYAPMVIGSVNILIGILTTIQQYLKISELNEAHRASAISWDKFARNIRIELAKCPKERTDAGLFIKVCRNEFDRLMETSPAISPDIVLAFKSTFSGEKSCIFEMIDKCLGFSGAIDIKEIEKRKRQFDALCKPDICDIIITVNDNRHKWYESVDIATSTETFLAMDTSIDVAILEREEELKIRETEMKNKEAALRNRIAEEKNQEIRRHDEEARLKLIATNLDTYIIQFLNSKGRRPFREEVYDHFKGKFDVDSLGPFLDKHPEYCIV